MDTFITFDCGFHFIHISDCAALFQALRTTVGGEGDIT